MGRDLVDDRLKWIDPLNKFTLILKISPYSRLTASGLRPHIGIDRDAVSKMRAIPPSRHATSGLSTPRDLETCREILSVVTSIKSRNRRMEVNFEFYEGHVENV